MALRIIEALDAYLRAVDKRVDGNDALDELQKAWKELRRARADITFVDDALLEAARAKYTDSSDDVEIDDGALITRGGDDDGTWVMAWVWMRDEE
ncbi:hypothetical protein [Paraburkholderia sp.]|uniref:hypothetical protein n=1 Tax=Paraburkholderia sp. TaxID=1926495 RepID=UPI0039E56C15